MKVFVRIDRAIPDGFNICATISAVLSTNRVCLQAALLPSKS